MPNSLSSFTLFRTSVKPGDLVVCHGIKGFRNQRMAARVLSDAGMPYPAREGFAWVRETGLDVVGEAFVIEWPINKME